MTAGERTQDNETDSKFDDIFNVGALLDCLKLQLDSKYVTSYYI